MTAQEIIHKRLGKIEVYRAACKKNLHKYSEGVLDTINEEEQVLKNILYVLSNK